MIFASPDKRKRNRIKQHTATTRTTMVEYRKEERRTTTDAGTTTSYTETVKPTVGERLHNAKENVKSKLHQATAPSAPTTTGGTYHHTTTTHTERRTY